MLSPLGRNLRPRSNLLKIQHAICSVWPKPTLQVPPISIDSRLRPPSEASLQLLVQLIFQRVRYEPADRGNMTKAMA